METGGLYFIMVLLKLGMEFTQCTVVNSTINATSEKLDHDIVTTTMPASSARDSTLRYRDNITTTMSVLDSNRSTTSDIILPNKDDIIPPNKNLTTTIDNIAQNKSSTVTDRSMVKSNDIVLTDDVVLSNNSTTIDSDHALNNNSKTMTAATVPNNNRQNITGDANLKHENRSVAADTSLKNDSRTKVNATVLNEKATTKDKDTTLDNTSGATTNKLTATESNWKTSNNAVLTNSNRSLTSDIILNNSGSAINSQVSPWTTQCVANCSCFKDISDLGSHFDPPIALNTRMKIVNCTGRAFQTIPIQVPTGTDVLYLNNNNIFKLDKFPHLPELIYLDLSNNYIQTIYNPPLFSLFRKLKHISLKNNQIKSIDQGCFNGLFSLDNLDLGFNQISSIHSHAFTGLHHLKLLNLRGNRLSNISADWFKAVFDIRELDLSRNLLTSIDIDILDPLTNLYSLNIADNQIKNIDLEAFRGLQKLKILNLSNNQITQVPTYQLRSLSSLGKIILNGNLMTKIRSGDFFKLNITSLSISYMQKLVVVEKLAFHALPFLENLHAHDNPKLIFIDHAAFQLVPNLKRLYVHNNDLSAMSPSMLNFLPNLEEIHLYHNPLRCDCNAYWVKEILESAKQSNYSKPYFNHSQFIKCGYPFNVTGRPLTEINENYFSRVCAPTTIQLFADKYQLDLGEELQLECHAFGVPDPTITWTLPNGTIIDPSMPRNRITKTIDKITMIDDCVLIVKHLSTKDSGTYSCKSDNGFGYDISSTRVIVSNKPVRLFPYTINSDYISISWNGTQHKSMISDYQLHYREVANDNHLSQVEPEKYEASVIQLGPQYHSYTVTKLKPQTKYEFCLVYLYKQESYKVDCRNVSTQAQSDSETGIQRLVSDKLIIGVSTAIGLIILLTCIIMLAKKFCGQRDYQHPYDSDESETINIPLDNLYHPLSVPVCSSKTSLLSKHLD